MAFPSQFQGGTSFTCIKGTAGVRDQNHPSLPPYISKRKWLWICSVTFELLSQIKNEKQSVSRDLRRGGWKWGFFEESYCWICNSHCASGIAQLCYLRTICLLRRTSRSHLENMGSCTSGSCWIYVWKNKNRLWDGTWLYAGSLGRSRGFDGGSKRLLLRCNWPGCVWAKDVYISEDYGTMCVWQRAYRGLY